MKRRGAPYSIAGLAVAGAAAAHAISYTAVAGSGAAALMRHTGHGYFGSAVAGAVAAGLIAAAVTIGRRAIHAELAPVPFATKLAAAQMGLFVLVEVGERLAAGVPVGSVFSRGLLFAGVALQAIVAIAITAIITYLGRGAERAARIIGRAFPAPQALVSSPAPVLSATPARDPRVYAYFVRGPPSA